MSRPYFVTFNGVTRMVEAATPAAAVQHVVAGVTQVRPAKASEVVDWARAGTPIEKAGEGVPDKAWPAGGDAGPATAEFGTEDLAQFLLDNCADPAQKEIVSRMFDDMVAAGVMTIGDFKQLATNVPEFEEAMATPFEPTDLPEGQASIGGLKTFTNALETEPMPIADVVALVAAFVAPESVEA